jgi:hypothetical protein
MVSIPGRLTAYERGDMVLLGKISFQNSNPPATVIPESTRAALGRSLGCFHHRAHSDEGCALEHRE